MHRLSLGLRGELSHGSSYIPTWNPCIFKGENYPPFPVFWSSTRFPGLLYDLRQTANDSLHLLSEARQIYMPQMHGRSSFLRICISVSKVDRTKLQ